MKQKINISIGIFQPFCLEDDCPCINICSQNKVSRIGMTPDLEIKNGEGFCSKVDTGIMRGELRFSGDKPTPTF